MPLRALAAVGWSAPSQRGGCCGGARARHPLPPATLPVGPAGPRTLPRSWRGTAALPPSSRRPSLAAAARNKQASNPFAEPPSTAAAEDDSDPDADTPPRKVAAAGGGEGGAKVKAKGRAGKKERMKESYKMERGVALKREGPTLAKLAGIEVGQKLGGRVRVMLEYGAVVNVRAEQDALLHVTQIPKSSDFQNMRRGSKLHDLRVIECNESKGVLKVSMRAPAGEKPGYLEKPKIRVKDMAEGEVYEAVAKKFLNATGEDGETKTGGAFVDFGGQVDGFLEDSSEIPTWSGAKFEVVVAPGGLSDDNVKRRRRVLMVLDDGSWGDDEDWDDDEGVEAAGGPPPPPSIFKASDPAAAPKGKGLGALAGAVAKAGAAGAGAAKPAEATGAAKDAASGSGAAAEEGAKEKEEEEEWEDDDGDFFDDEDYKYSEFDDMY